MALESLNSDKRAWRTIAQELSGEHDAARMMELSKELLAAMDKEEPVLRRAKQNTNAEKDEIALRSKHGVSQKSDYRFRKD